MILHQMSLLRIVGVVSQEKDLHNNLDCDWLNETTWGTMKPGFQN